MIKTYIIKIQSRNLIHYHRLLAMIPKNKDPWQDHPIKKRIVHNDWRNYLEYYNGFIYYLYFLICKNSEQFKFDIQYRRRFSILLWNHTKKVVLITNEKIQKSYPLYHLTPKGQCFNFEAKKKCWVSSKVSKILKTLIFSKDEEQNILSFF